MMPAITPEQALENLDKAASSITANRETHLILSLSVQVLRDLLPAKEAAE